MKTYLYPLCSGIRATPEFSRKGLAQFAVNVGLKCGHDCTYCSSGATLRCHRAFKETGESPFGRGYSIVDPEMPEKVARDAAKYRQRGIVQLCTTVDAWAPEAQKYDLGRKCLKAILKEPGWSVRILTKNAAVAEDFDIVRKHRDRVLVGLSLTGTPEKEGVLSITEPYASPITERMAAMKKARKLGLRTFGMLCPLLPGVADAAEQIGWLVRFAKQCGAEELFSEAINPRGKGLTVTEDALREAGFTSEATAVGQIRDRGRWSRYVTDLIRNMQQAMRMEMSTAQLRFLLYPGGLTTEDKARIRKADAGVVWLA